MNQPEPKRFRVVREPARESEPTRFRIVDRDLDGDARAWRLQQAEQLLREAGGTQRADGTGELREGD